MRKRDLQRRISYEEEARMGLAWQVRARLRPLQAWEQPPDADLCDDRMVEFFMVKDGMTTLDSVGAYYPLLAPDLLPDFLALFAREPPAPERKVVEFYARYGAVSEHVLIDGKRWPAWTARLSAEDRGQLSTEARLGLCEPIWWLRERARELRVTYDIYVALREGSLPALRAMIGRVPEGKRIISIGIAAGQISRTVTDDERGAGRRAGSFAPEPDPAPVTDPSTLAPLPDEQVLFWARQLLAYQLNIGESRSKRRWDQYVDLPGIPTPREQQALGAPASDPLGLVRCRSAQDLTAAMYLQLGELAARHVVLYQCEGCGRLFYRHHGKQRFCGASCGDAARQRDYYRNAKATAARAARRQPKKRR